MDSSFSKRSWKSKENSSLLSSKNFQNEYVNKLDINFLKRAFLNRPILRQTKLCHHPSRPTTTHHNPPRPTTTNHPPTAKLYPPRPTTTHHHPPLPTTSQNISTTTHHQPKYIYHHTPPPKKWTKIYSYITSF